MYICKFHSYFHANKTVLAICKALTLMIQLHWNNNLNFLVSSLNYLKYFFLLSNNPYNTKLYNSSAFSVLTRVRDDTFTVQVKSAMLLNDHSFLSKRKFQQLLKALSVSIIFLLEKKKKKKILHGREAEVRQVICAMFPLKTNQLVTKKLPRQEAITVKADCLAFLRHKLISPTVWAYRENSSSTCYSENETSTDHSSPSKNIKVKKVSWKTWHKIEGLGCKCHCVDVESILRTGSTWRGTLLHIQFYQK